MNLTENQLKQKIKDYEKEIKAGNNSYHDLGMALSDLANLKENISEKEQLLKESIKNYEKAIELDKNESSYYCNLYQI